MSRYNKRIWCAGLVLTVALLGSGIWGWSDPTQESTPPFFVAALSTPSLPPVFVFKSVRDQPDQPNPPLRRKRTTEDAWERFEAEFRVSTPSPSPVKRQIETAKYNLDVTVFSADRFVKHLRERVDFEYSPDGWRRTRANTRGGFLDNPRVKLDLDMTHSKPFLGFRVVIPVGN